MPRYKILIFALIIISFTAISCARLARWQEAHTPPDDACRHCHYAIYKDFQISYRPYNVGAKSEDYQPFHSRPMSGSDVRMAQSHGSGKGDCTECHIVKGPQEHLVISRIGVSFNDTTYQLCGRCHQKTFEEWKRSRFAKEEKSCMVCHADSREKSVTDDKNYYHSREGVKGLAEERINPAIRLERLKEAILLAEDIIVNGNSVSVYLAVINQGAGHNIPTGDDSGALFKARLSFIDPGGKVLAVKEETIGGRKGVRISSGREAMFDIAFNAPSKGEYELEIALLYMNEKSGSPEEVKLSAKKVKVSI